MTWYIVLLHDTIGYIVECHVVTVKEFLSLAGKFMNWLLSQAASLLYFRAFCFFLRQYFTACRRANNSEKISLHRTGFPAILIRCAAGDVGDKQQTSIQDVEHDKYAQLMLVWIEALGYLYADIRNGAYKKCNDYSS
jgi:hypothetical protein